MPPRAVFARRDIQPAADVYVNGSEHMLVSIWTSVGNLAVQVRAVIQLTTGEVVVSTLDVVVSLKNRLQNTQIFILPEGFLLGAMVVPSLLSLKRGQCYAQLALTKGADASAPASRLLTQGYVEGASPLAWPSCVPESMIAGRGLIRSITGSSAGLGLQIGESMPINTLWRPLAFRAVLTTNAVVANRVAKLNILDGAGNSIGIFSSNYDQVAGETVGYAWGALSSSPTKRGFWVSIAIPAELLLAYGAAFQTLVDGMTGGDFWGIPEYSVEEWIQD